MRLESIIQSIQSMPSGKSVQRSARMLGVFALMIVSLNGFAAADDAADAAGIITPCDPLWSRIVSARLSCGTGVNSKVDWWMASRLGRA